MLAAPPKEVLNELDAQMVATVVSGRWYSSTAEVPAQGYGEDRLLAGEDAWGVFDNIVTLTAIQKLMVEGAIAYRIEMTAWRNAALVGVFVVAANT